MGPSALTRSILGRIQTLTTPSFDDRSHFGDTVYPVFAIIAILFSVYTRSMNQCHLEVIIVLVLRELYKARGTMSDSHLRPAKPP